MIKKASTIEIKKAIEQLPVKERVKLIQELRKNKDTQKEEFAQLVKRIRSRVKKHPISQKEINKLCEEARSEVYARSHS